MSLSSALNWYHKKIGAYDKKLWEKSVDQRILRGVCAIPRKTARLKTELIDVDLVQGSAFAKAKPQDSWIVSTASGIKRILLFPFYFSWWKVQTNRKITCMFVSLYFLQISALYLYFTAEDKEIPDVPVFEVVTSVFMMLILGIMHSQIVASFTSPKSCRKHITRTKRRRAKSKLFKKSFTYEQDNSSPDSCSDFKPKSFYKRKSSQTLTCDLEESCTLPQSESAADLENDKKENCNCKKDFKSGQRTSLLDQFEENDENAFSFDKSIETVSKLGTNTQEAFLNSKANKALNFSEGSYTSQISRDSAYGECNHPSLESLECSHALQRQKSMSKIIEDLRQKSCDSVLQSSIEKEQGDLSSSEEFFVAKKIKNASREWNHAIPSMEQNASLKSCLEEDSMANRRYSDVGPTNKKLRVPYIIEKECTQSADNILCSERLEFCNSARSIRNSPVHKSTLKDREKLQLSDIRPLIELPLSVKDFSSSCDSADGSSPTSRLKNQTSDLDWPLMTNTDCNSDSSGCSNKFSKDLSDVTPAENPFAWEIYERSKKISSKEFCSAGKISCTIWEGSECKKADLTALEISSTIIQKVDSTYHSTEYLYIGFLFAAIVSFLPLMFRLKNCVTISDMQDVASDVLTLNVPSSEEVVRITDSLIELMWGKELRMKTIVCITMLERFSVSFAFFFLLSVAEKTFKQRFLFAKHFCYLTSSRGAKRSNLPHFRLNKVKNIKTWLSIRSYMKKLGPQRSVDVIVSMTFILEVCVVSYLCIQFLKENGRFSDQLHCWELLFWTLALGIYLLRFMIIGTKINKKYRNLSVLLTEQINLYLHMEQKPHKKEELILANNVLKLAADLLKELESPFKISGICANSYLYNITKVIVLSAFSAMLTDILGFKLKLYKIKLK